MSAQHRVQDHLQQTMDLSQNQSQKTHTERTVLRTKGNAAHSAMEAATKARERQEEAKRLFEQRCKGAAEAEMAHNEAIKRTLEETEALERHVKSVTMRAESLATTEADFFQTLFERQ